jgi:hypothetical protein
MYQAQLAEAILRLAEVAGQSLKPAAARVASLARTAGQRMITALAPLVHPDGDYALMHDTALGVAQDGGHDGAYLRDGGCGSRNVGAR